MTSITEWTFTGEVLSKINEILRERPDLPFSEAKTEERGRGSQKRRDLTIYNREKKVILTGEIKLPDKPDGHTPYDQAVVIDAHNKANQIGVEYYFTWNVNKCVLWKTFEQGKSITERYLEPFEVLPSPIRKSEELEHPRVKAQIHQFLVKFLERCAAIISGADPMALLPLDIKFIDIWESGLFPLVVETLSAINDLYENDRKFKSDLDKWMRDQQGWTLSNVEETLRENLERAAKFSCYVFANKIVFYKALRRHFTRMKALKVPTSVKTGDELKKTLQDYFEQAMRATEDYETVFTGDFGDSLPFLRSSVVNSWRVLIEQTDPFDFTQIPYEVMGQIFERLLSPSERHKFGQHYTRSEVVDLINTFCIRDGEATVMDPACGGGTFLVRAYQHKSDLSNKTLSHTEIIHSLYGIDISAYPAHLTTINLATREFVQQANYPLVARCDFLKTKVGEGIFHIPLGKFGRGAQTSLMELPKVDVVVSNPPYVRQEKIDEYYGKGYKKFLRDEAKLDVADVVLSGRSDILCYFFTHGGTFLKDEGYMGLLTSSNWLDTTYGFILQKYLLNNYEIIAILESNCEPWFVGARVTTAATILRKQADPIKRNANNIKFVWLKRPIKEFLSYPNDEYARRTAFEDLRSRILELTTDEETEIWRVRVRNQAELYQIGCLKIRISEEDEDNEDESTSTYSFINKELPGIEKDIAQPLIGGDYIGYKWGIFLRAPEIFFKLQARSNRFVALGEIAEIKRGVVSGCDDFYFPRDITDKAMSSNLDNEEFKNMYGIQRSETQRIRIVLAGDKSQHLIESKYLEPEIHSLMEIDSVGIDSRKLKRKVLLVADKKEDLVGTYVLKYIEWGEREGFHERPTVQSRAIENRKWYDLTNSLREEIILPKIQQYRHIISSNPNRYICSSSLLTVNIDKSLTDVTCAILNSTIVALIKQFFGRMHGREASLQLDVYAARMMKVPNPRFVTSDISERLIDSLNSMCKRQSQQLVDVDFIGNSFSGELSLPDRQRLDDAVLELLGVTDKEERLNLRNELYEEITLLYQQLRTAEVEMQHFRSATGQQARTSAQTIATEIWDSLETPFIYRTPLDFISKGTTTKEINMVEGHGRIIKGHMFQPYGVQFGEIFLELGDLAHCEFVKKLSDLKIRGVIQIPIDAESCHSALRKYKVYLDEMNKEFANLAAAYTADEAMQNNVVKELWRKLRV